MAVLLLAKKTPLGRYLPSPNLRFWSRGADAEQGAYEDAEHGASGANGNPACNGNGAETSLSVQNNSIPAPIVDVVNYAIVHRIAGRVRIQIPRLAHDVDFARQLQDQVVALPLVTQVRINRTTRALIVHYQCTSAAEQQVGSEPILPQIVECIRTAARAETAVDLTPAKNGTATGEINYVQRLSLPVLGIGLSAGAAAGLAVPGILVGGAILAAATPIFKRTWQGIRDEKRLTVDFLDAASIALMTLQATFLAPACVVGIIEGAEVARDWTARRRQDATTELLEAHQESAIVERDGQGLEVMLDELVAGDIVLVYPGDQIPVDGRVLEGTAWVDQSQVTGHSDLVAYKVGDEVLAAGIVVEGHLRILAQSVGQDTLVARMLTFVENATDVDTRSSNHARRVGNKFVYPTLAVGAAVLATSGSMARFAGILSLDLGTGMRVSAPIAILSAQTYAAQRGILIRSGRAVEMLAKVDTVVFDKTATLTQGRAAVVGVQTVQPRITPGEVLGLAASAEQNLSHPVAEAIVRHARAMDIPLLACSNWHYFAGEGVQAEIDGQVVHVGNRRLMDHIGTDMAAASFQLPNSQLATASCAYVAWNRHLVGVIYTTDPVRQESAEVITTLGEMQLTSHMLSGDRQAVAQATAEVVGIASANVAAGLLPEQKLELVQRLQESGRTVAMVGDGINDAAAMAHAHVSIALGSATDLARNTADVVLLNDDLRDLVEATRIARHAMQTIRQNEALMIGSNVSAIAYATLLPLSPVAGVVVNNGTAFLAALNSLRPLLGTKSKSNVR